MTSWPGPYEIVNPRCPVDMELMTFDGMAASTSKPARFIYVCNTCGEKTEILLSADPETELAASAAEAARLITGDPDGLKKYDSASEISATGRATGKIL